MILARARSLISAPAFDVISASVSLNVLAFREHAGPISCKRLAIAAAGSAPFKGEILLPIPGERGPNESIGRLFGLILVNASSC